MKTLFALFTCLALLAPAPGARAQAPDGSFFVGYNQAWFNNSFGHDLTDTFDLGVVRDTLSAIRRAGGSVVRIFLFTRHQGISMANSVPTGISAEMLANLGSVLRIAREEKLRVYVTPLSSGDVLESEGEWREFYENVFLHDAVSDTFNQKVMAPILEVLDQNRDVVYAMDLTNEIDGLILNLIATPGQVQHWVQRNAAFVKAHSPWLQITVSVGFFAAQYQLIYGLLTGLGLDFYDLHVYDDSGSFWGIADLCDKVKADNVPLLLGEFGQKTEEPSEQLQYEATAHFLSTARDNCFSGALAWTFEHAHTPWWSYRRQDGTLKPAAALLPAATRAPAATIRR